VCEVTAGHTLPALRTHAQASADDAARIHVSVEHLYALVGRQRRAQPVLLLAPSTDSRHGRSSFWSCGSCARKNRQNSTEIQAALFAVFQATGAPTQPVKRPAAHQARRQTLPMRHKIQAAHQRHVIAGGTTGSRFAGPFHDGRLCLRFRAFFAPCQSRLRAPSARAVRFQSQPAPARLAPAPHSASDGQWPGIRAAHGNLCASLKRSEKRFSVFIGPSSPSIRPLLPAEKIPPKDAPLVRCQQLLRLNSCSLQCKKRPRGGLFAGSNCLVIHRLRCTIFDPVNLLPPLRSNFSSMFAQMNASQRSAPASMCSSLIAAWGAPTS